MPLETSDQKELVWFVAEFSYKQYIVLFLIGSSTSLVHTEISQQLLDGLL